jgi:hypothetical protein
MSRRAAFAVIAGVALAVSACARNPLAPDAAPGPITGGAAVAAKGGNGGGNKPPAEQPVTAVFRCPGPDCTGNDRVTGDGYAAPYAAFIDGGGNLRITLPDGSRSVTFDYTECLEPCPVGRRWFTTASPTGDNGLLMHTSVLIPGTEDETPAGLNDIPVGETWFSRIKMGYHLASPTGEDLVWGTRFNPFFPGSTNLQVTRVSDDEWFFEALPTQIAFVRSTAQGPTKGKPSTDPAEVFEGNYIMPFRITVTR